MQKHIYNVSHLNRAVCFTKHAWNKHTCMIYHIWLRFVLFLQYAKNTHDAKTHVWCITSESSCVVLPSTPQTKTYVWCIKSESGLCIVLQRTHDANTHVCCITSESSLSRFTKHHSKQNTCVLWCIRSESRLFCSTQHSCNKNTCMMYHIWIELFVLQNTPETKTHVWCITSESTCVVVPNTPQTKTYVWCIRSESSLFRLTKNTHDANAHVCCIDIISEWSLSRFTKHHSKQNTSVMYQIWIQFVLFHEAHLKQKHMYDVSHLSLVCVVSQSAPEIKTQVWCITSESRVDCSTKNTHNKKHMLW
jgi:hypothetical protein